MRAIILSHRYLDPESRGKLRALSGLGPTVVAAVPGGVAGEDGGLRVVPVSTPGDEWNRRAIRRLFTDFQPDLVQIEEEPDTRAAATAATEAARLGIPVVLFSWESAPPGGGFWARRRAARSLRAARGAIGGNALAAERLQLLLPTFPVASIPQTGVTLPPLAPRAPSEVLSIGYVGRLVPERGVDVLLRACASIMGAWSLTVAGTGPDQEALELLAQRLGLASRIRWLGGVSRSEIEALLPELDCFVLPARRAEPWSPVLIDAMARGVIPIVMAGSVPEAVVGKAGKVAQDGESLGLALQTLRAYPEDRRRLSAAARQRVLERFVDAALAQQTLALWQEVAGVSAG